MLERVKSLLIAPSFRVLPRSFSRNISIPYRKMAGVPSTYDGALLPQRNPHKHH